MSYFDRVATSWMSSSFEALDNSRTKVRVLVAAGGLVATIVLWVVHLSYPYIVREALERDSKMITLTLFVITVAPPFAVAFGLGSLIARKATEPIADESGPMSGYFYREKANAEWKLAMVAGFIGGLNFLLMFITSQT